MRALRLTILLACAAALTVGLTACGSATVNHYADNEGVYVNVGPLKYQVQISRQLNPYDTEDRFYLQGLTTAQSVLLPTQQWFGVFVMAQNLTGRPQLPSEDFYITDASHNIYQPTTIAGTNNYALRPELIPPHGFMPQPGSPAATGPTGGALVLFKLPYAADDNRPLLLHIYDATNPAHRATVELDV
jgi:hypothetical protein